MSSYALFGSRLHDHLKGGDIDLHFEVGREVPSLRATSRFLGLVEEALDGRKVDTVFSVRGGQHRGFERIAYRDGLVL